MSWKGKKKLYSYNNIDTYLTVFQYIFFIRIIQFWCPRFLKNYPSHPYLFELEWWRLSSSWFLIFLNPNPGFGVLQANMMCYPKTKFVWRRHFIYFFYWFIWILISYKYVFLGSNCLFLLIFHVLYTSIFIFIPQCNDSKW